MISDPADYYSMVDAFLAEYDRLSVLLLDKRAARAHANLRRALDEHCCRMAAEMDLIPGFGNQHLPAVPDIQLTNSAKSRLVYRDFIVTGRPRKKLLGPAFQWLQAWDSARPPTEISLRKAVKVALVTDDQSMTKLPNHCFGLTVLWAAVVADISARDRTRHEFPESRVY